MLTIASIVYIKYIDCLHARYRPEGDTCQDFTLN
jgi:hypothetical protein